MRQNINKKWILVFGIFLIAIPLCFGGCSITRKLNAAEILTNTKFEFEGLAVESVTINKNLFPKVEGLGNFLPSPQVVTLVQDFAKGILEMELGTIGLTATVIATNQGKDSLWIRNLQATLTLDSLMELPVTLKDSSMLAPGENRLEFNVSFPIDKRIFALQDISNVALKGGLTVALDFDGDAVPLTIDVKQTITHEEVVALSDKARNSILNNIINDWVGAFGF